jgi:hypothetical protein
MRRAAVPPLSKASAVGCELGDSAAPGVTRAVRGARLFRGGTWPKSTPARGPCLQLRHAIMMARAHTEELRRAHGLD